MTAGGQTGHGSHRQTVRQKQGLRTDPIHSPCRVFETFQRICSACRRRLQPCQTAQLIQRCAAVEHTAGNQIAVAALFQSLHRLAHAAAAEDDDFVPDRAESGLTGWIDCFARARLAGSVFAGGVNGPGETAGHKALAQAYEMGKTV